MDTPSRPVTQVDRTQVDASSGGRVALVAGGTGLVGRALLAQLADDALYHSTIAVGRTEPPLGAGQRFLRSDDMAPALAEIGMRVDDAYCCLGTTMRKAGSRAAFERVDFHLVLAFARAARAAGASRFIVVSSIGASSSAPSFYLRVKARMEDAVAEAGFEAVHVLRPSLLLGERGENRRGEDLAQRLMPRLAPLMRGPLAPFRPITAASVASSMRAAARMPSRGLHVHAPPLDPP